MTENKYGFTPEELTAAARYRDEIECKTLAMRADLKWLASLAGLSIEPSSLDELVGRAKAADYYEWYV